MSNLYNDEANKNISLAIFSQFAILTIQYLVLGFFSIDGTTIGSLVKMISKIAVGIFFLRAFRTVLKRQLNTAVIIYSCFIVIFSLNLFIFPYNSALMQSVLFEFFIVCLPCFIYSYSIDDYEVMFYVLNKVANIILIAGLIISILMLINRINIGSYSMALSYYLLIPSLFYLYKFYNFFSLKYLILFIVSIVAILLIGARGPVLCIAVYTIIYLLNNIKGKIDTKKLVIYVVILMLLFISLMFFRILLSFLNDILERLNIYSRTVYILLNNLTHLSGRDELYLNALQLIKQNPILGIGITGDRYYLDMYVHNLFLEIILNFGVVMGLSIIIILTGIIVKTIFLTEKELSNILLIFFCLSIVPLMISGTYLNFAWFWIYLGMILKLAIKKTDI